MLKQYIIFGKDILENLALDNMYLGHLFPTFLLHHNGIPLVFYNLYKQTYDPRMRIQFQGLVSIGNESISIRGSIFHTPDKTSILWLYLSQQHCPDKVLFLPNKMGNHRQKSNIYPILSAAGLSGQSCSSHLSERSISNG